MASMILLRKLLMIAFCFQTAFSRPLVTGCPCLSEDQFCDVWGQCQPCWNYNASQSATHDIGKCDYDNEQDDIRQNVSTTLSTGWIIFLAILCVFLFAVVAWVCDTIRRKRQNTKSGTVEPPVSFSTSAESCSQEVINGMAESGQPQTQNGHVPEAQTGSGSANDNNNELGEENSKRTSESDDGNQQGSRASVSSMDSNIESPANAME